MPSPGTVRLYLVEPATGRIWSTTGDTPDIIDVARQRDEVAGRVARAYQLHERNPRPGLAVGYYVYRCDVPENPLVDDESVDPHEPYVRDWVLVGFLEVVQPEAATGRQESAEALRVQLPAQEAPPEAHVPPSPSHSGDAPAA